MLIWILRKQQWIKQTKPPFSSCLCVCVWETEMMNMIYNHIKHCIVFYTSPYYVNSEKGNRLHWEIAIWGKTWGRCFFYSVGNWWKKSDYFYERIYIRGIKQISLSVQDKYINCLKEFISKSVGWLREEGMGKLVRGERLGLTGLIRIWFHQTWEAGWDVWNSQ